MLCRAKQARKRGGYTAAVLAPAALSAYPYICTDGYVCNIPNAYSARTSEPTEEVRKWAKPRWRGWCEIYITIDAQHHPLHRVYLIAPVRPWRRRDSQAEVINREEPRSREILQDDEISCTKHFPTTQNRSTGCAPEAEATCYKRSSRFVPSKCSARPRELLAVFAPSPALGRLIFEFWRNRRRSTEDARQPDTRAGQPSPVKERDGSADWRIWDRRDPGGHTKLSEKAGCKGWRAGVANPIHFFNAPKQGRTASVSGVPPTIPPGASTVS